MNHTAAKMIIWILKTLVQKDLSRWTQLKNSSSFAITFRVHALACEFCRASLAEFSKLKFEL